MFFFFNDTATTEIYTLSLHDALPIWSWGVCWNVGSGGPSYATRPSRITTVRPMSGSRGPISWGTRTIVVPRSTSRPTTAASRSEEHTSELQSRQYLVRRLLLLKKKKY